MFKRVSPLRASTLRYRPLACQLFFPTTNRSRLTPPFLSAGIGLPPRRDAHFGSSWLETIRRLNTRFNVQAFKVVAGIIVAILAVAFSGDPLVASVLQARTGK